MTYPVFASGDVLNASDMNGVGLWLVKSQTVGTGVSSVTVTGAFSADYDNYLVTITGVQGSALGDVQLQLGSTTTGYYGFMPYGIPSGATLFAVNTNNGASFPYVASSDATAQSAGQITLNSPFLSKNTFISAPYIGGGNNRAYGVFNGWLNNSTSYTSFSLIPGAGTLTGGTIRVYGYRN
jgi:hypothetical protein